MKKREEEEEKVSHLITTLCKLWKHLLPFRPLRNTNKLKCTVLIQKNLEAKKKEAAAKKNCSYYSWLEQVECSEL